MQLIKEHWNKKDIKEFQEYLLTFSKGQEKGEWEQRIVNTKLNCIAVPSQTVKKITNEIGKGNFLEFIYLWPWENFTNTTIIGGLICKINDFNLQTQLLEKYSTMADNWATIDTIKIKPKNNKQEYFDFAKKLCNSSHTFSRRLGVILMLKILDENNVRDILSFLPIFENETEYYVNMAVAWLISECFVKFREQTMPFFEKNNLCKFTINKAISKCRDSYRVTKEDKDMLLNYKK